MVDTMPMETLPAADHGQALDPTAKRADVDALAQGGIDFDQVTHAVLADGVNTVEDAMGLLDGVEERRVAAVGDR